MSVCTISSLLRVNSLVSTTYITHFKHLPRLQLAQEPTQTKRVLHTWAQLLLLAHGFKNLENTVVSHYLEPQFRSQTFVSIKHCHFTLDNLNLGSLKNSVNSNQICLLLRKCSHIYTPFILNERRKKEHISKLKKFMWDKMHKTEISKVALLVVVFIKYKWHIKWACLQTTETFDFTAPYPSEFLVTLCGGKDILWNHTI